MLIASPGALVFKRDMVMNIPVIANIATIQNRQQVLVDRNAIAANNRRLSHDYEVGEEILLLVKDIKRKISDQAIGPFRITRVHANGTVTIQRSPTVVERINIRQIKPYRR